ncbi:MAG: F0F1 ATP synthase subunit alpha, partial [Clostridia bacterium]|nr:F0F1 ATP synthase subunit alpha [Clostridia bacterium]
DFLRERIKSFSPEPVSYQRGTVTKAGDGVVRISGLPGRVYGELLEFESGAFGMALDLEEDGVGAVLLDKSDTVASGDGVRGTGTVMKAPVGYGMLGRTVDPVGRELDGMPLEINEYLPVERSAPSVMDRRPIDTPLETGILAIDSMIPIGRGQRELIIGDRITGKTTILTDTIINQKDKDVICIYCAISKKASDIMDIIQTLKSADALRYSVIVASTAADSPAMQYLAPYFACTVGEWFMERGKDVLVIYDDLSKHAVAYRTMSLLLHRPPGREAYPGDVFYLHSRLLERSACLSYESGGGTLTAMPIIETAAGNIASYIPTNVISITDGQIYLESGLFNSGIRPAINIGLSVSRVGRAAQFKAMREVSGTLRLDLAQYREMKVFAGFGTDIDDSTQKMLDRGERLSAIFRQNKNTPYTLFDQILLIMAYDSDAFLSVKMKDMEKAKSELILYASDTIPDVKEAVNRSGELGEEAKETITATVKEFFLSFKKKK